MIIPFPKRLSPRQPPTDQTAAADELLPDRIVGRLAEAGIRSLSDWKKLTRKEKHSIWGVTPRYIDVLDELAWRTRP